jgi:hypothetical protein
MEFIADWQSIADREDVKALYAGDGSNAELLPWSVRADLGQKLCDAGFEETSSKRKSVYIKELEQCLKTEEAKLQWEKFTKGKLSDPAGGKRKHTNSSVFDIIKQCVERERALVDAVAENASVQDVEMSEAGEEDEAASTNQSDHSMQLSFEDKVVVKEENFEECDEYVDAQEFKPQTVIELDDSFDSKPYSPSDGYEEQAFQGAVVLPPIIAKTIAQLRGASS